MDALFDDPYDDMNRYGHVGLVLGKFMPLHVGHEALLRFAKGHSRHLIVLVGATKEEPIPGPTRFNWLRRRFLGASNVEVHYTDHDFPQAQESDREVSRYWANWLKEMFPDVTCIFTSEPYGEYVAEYMGIQHMCFDEPRAQLPVSGTMVRQNPMMYWEYLSDWAKPDFVKKVCIFGPESVGKSTMAVRLAEHFKTNFVPEMGRDMMETSYTCTYEDMAKIGLAQALEMHRRKRWGSTRRMLFCDSDLMTTEIYSEYLFGKVPVFPERVKKENKYDLYLFLENDVPYVQDGTRLGEHTQNGLRQVFEEELKGSGAKYLVINGSDWEGRFQQCVEAVEKHILQAPFSAMVEQVGLAES